MGDVYTLLCLRSAELSKALGLRKQHDIDLHIHVHVAKANIGLTYETFYRGLFQTYHNSHW